MHARSLQNAFFLGLLLLTTLAFLDLIQDFLQPIFWAAVLATLFYPMYQWWKHQLGGFSALASVSTIVVIVLIVIVPLVLLGVLVASEASALYQRLTSGEVDLSSAVQTFDQAVPAATSLLERLGLSIADLQQQLSDAAVGTSRTVASNLLAFGQNTLRVGVLFFLMLYLLFFFLRDGHQLLNAIVRVLPLGDNRERALFQKFAEVSRATIKGTIVIGLVQGLFGGVIFWILGIDAAALWGVVMAVLSLLPAVGAALVWAPAAVILALIGQPLKGGILLIFGIVIIGLADNVLRPILVGRDTQMPDYIVLVTTLGGITLFGLSGVVIGPIIGALFLSVWDMFGEEYAEIATDDRPQDAVSSDHSSIGTNPDRPAPD